MGRLQFEEFELRIGRGRLGSYPTWVVRSPAGEADGMLTLPFGPARLKDIKTLVALAMLRSRQRTRAALSSELRELKSFGSELFDALFQDAIRTAYESSRNLALSQGKGLRIKLRIEPGELIDLPWEFLYDGTARRFIALSARTPLVRYVELETPLPPLKLTPPLHLLVVIANPSDYGMLDVARETQRIRLALGDLISEGLVDVDFLPRATVPALQERLREKPVHILHFIGHGDYSTEREAGVLVFEDEHGEGRRVRGEQLRHLFGDVLALRLVVLNACNGARGWERERDPLRAYPGIAESLVHEGIAGVVANQFEVTDEAAIIFARELYSSLADGYPVDAGVAEARKAVDLGLKNSVEWASPVLYSRAPDGLIFDMPTAGGHTAGNDAKLEFASSSALATSLTGVSRPLDLTTEEDGHSNGAPAAEVDSTVATTDQDRKLSQRLRLGVLGLLGALLFTAMGFAAAGRWFSPDIVGSASADRQPWVISTVQAPFVSRAATEPASPTATQSPTTVPAATATPKAMSTLTAPLPTSTSTPTAPLLPTSTSTRTAPPPDPPATEMPAVDPASELREVRLRNVPNTKSTTSTADGSHSAFSSPALTSIGRSMKRALEAATASPAPEPTATPSVTASPTHTPTVRPSVTPTSTATPTAEPTAAPTMTATATLTAEPTDTPTSTATPTAEPTATPTMTATATPTAEPTDTPTVMTTATPTAKPTDTPTMTATATPTAEPTDTPTVTTTATPTAKPTDTPTMTATATSTAEPTNTPTLKMTPTGTATQSPTPTRTSTRTPTTTPTRTATTTSTPTASPTSTPTPSPTFTRTPTPTVTPRPPATSTSMRTSAPTQTPRADAGTDPSAGTSFAELVLNLLRGVQTRTASSGGAPQPADVADTPTPTRTSALRSFRESAPTYQDSGGLTETIPTPQARASSAPAVVIATEAGYPAYNVRSGPSPRCPIVDGVSTGKQVVAHGGWSLANNTRYPTRWQWVLIETQTGQRGWVWGVGVRLLEDDVTLPAVAENDIPDCMVPLGAPTQTMPAPTQALQSNPAPATSTPVPATSTPTPLEFPRVTPTPVRAIPRPPTPTGG